MPQTPHARTFMFPRLKTLVAALGVALCAAPLLAAEHQMTKVNYDATRNVNVMDLVMSIDWDFDNPPEGRDKAFIEAIARQASASLFTMTEGRQMLGKVYVYKNSQFMNNTDIQYLQRNGRANAHPAGFTNCQSCRVQQFAGTGESAVDHGKTVAHEFGHYILGLMDEYREAGGTSTEPGSPQDGDTPRDSIMHDHLRFTNVSTADDYTDEALRKTAQYRVYGKSAWEVIVSPPASDPPTMTGRLQYEPFRTNFALPTAATLTRPTTGWENDLQMVYMGTAPASPTARAAGTTGVAGPINAIVIDTTTSAAHLKAQLHAAAQIIDASGASNRVMVVAHPFSAAPVVPLTLLSTDAARAAAKAALARVVADTSTDEMAVGDRLFDWAESQLPSLFPAGASSVSGGGFYYRLYATGKAVGVAGGKVFFYDGANLSDLGAATPWLAQARQSLSSSLLKTLDRLKSIKTLADTPTVTLLTTSTQTVDNSLVAAFRAANVSISPVALNLPATQAQALPRLRSASAGQTSLFDLAKGTFGTFKEANKPADLSKSAGKAANAAEGDSVETANEAEAASLAAGATHVLSTRVAAGGVDGQAVFQAFWEEDDEGKLAFTLTDPSGTSITPTRLPAGVTYSAPAGEGEASYTVSTDYAGRAGVWTSTLTASAATTDSVFQEVTVNSYLSASVDILGGTTADASPMVAVVEVSGPVAVKGATVTVELFSATTGASVRTGLVPLDNGVAPDLKAGDGKYTLSLADLPVGEYEIVATVSNDGSAVYSTAGNTKMGTNMPEEAVPAFQRVSSESFVKER